VAMIVSAHSTVASCLAEVIAVFLLAADGMRTNLTCDTFLAVILHAQVRQ
jgi:hypothetical protein